MASSYTWKPSRALTPEQHAEKASKGAKKAAQAKVVNQALLRRPAFLAIGTKAS